ncbi:cysteine-rich motor neuron 1 protein-like isoform X2 [Neocloeon triangulifer]|uniref:cysteine-rich motor neuron 1 protein-like isoform X2 n=1 Tax=Neocloeon triangulifer TaxID=2078957 RepID=UPI00286F0F37|nr:cysteine-rich motor neuron 1 protein-like isoform X2 [Neocloeon triangulifer]
MVRRSVLLLWLLGVLVGGDNSLHDHPHNSDFNKVGDGGGGWTAEGCSTVTGDTLAHGDHWWSEDRCMDCHCKHGQLECSAAACASCINPHYLPGACCPTCDDSDIHLPHCKLLEGCSLKCKHGLKKDGQGCFSCECHKIDDDECPLVCPDTGYVHDASGNQMCECVNHTLSSTPAPVHPSLGPRPCADGLLLRHDGELWNDGCRECVCRNGAHLCSLLGCPRCPGASYSLPGECCPRCNGSSSEGPAACQSADGAVYPVGERWKLDQCVSCECGEGGQVLCGQEPCPPAACDFPLPLVDGCCPRCPTVTHRPPPGAEACPAHRTEGESWRDGACSSCVCVKGQMVCYEQKCPPPACPFPVSISGRCCPVCTNVSNSCVLDNNTYMPGDTWTRPGCVECLCKEGGQIVCTHSPLCAPLNCQNSIKVPERCCPTCPSDLESGPSSNYMMRWIVLGTVAAVGVLSSLVACCIWRGGKWAYLQSWCCNSKVQSLKGPSPTLFYSPVKHLEPAEHNGTPGEYMQVNTEHDSSHV